MKVTILLLHPEPWPNSPLPFVPSALASEPVSRLEYFPNEHRCGACGERMVMAGFWVLIGRGDGEINRRVAPVGWDF